MVVMVVMRVIVVMVVIMVMVVTVVRAAWAPRSCRLRVARLAAEGQQWQDEG